MTNSIDQLKGSFPVVLIFTASDIEKVKLEVAAADMRDEIIGSLAANEESSVIFCTHKYPGDSESTLFSLFPESGRGGVCWGGLTEWFDATSLDDLEDQWIDSLAVNLNAQSS